MSDDLVTRLRRDAQGEDLGADSMGWSPDPALKRAAADEIDRLRAEVERLRSEVERLRVDAGRYRWLRDVPSDWAICEWMPDDPDGIGYYRDGRAAHVVDAAIDAAIRADRAAGDQSAG